MKHPLSINFKVLEQYDFSKTVCDEVIFFEWLILKRTSFGNNLFYYQQEKLMNELGIKRRRLETLKSNFIDKYGLIIEKGGFNNITHFTVPNKLIKKFVKENIKKEYQKDLESRLLKFQFSNKENLKPHQLGMVEATIYSLNTIFRQRRGIENQKNKNRELPESALSVNGKTRKQLGELLDNYDMSIIENSFIAFCDAMITKKDHTYHYLNNFTSYDKEEEKFGVFERYLEKFNNEYARDI